MAVEVPSFNNVILATSLAVQVHHPFQSDFKTIQYDEWKINTGFAIVLQLLPNWADWLLHEFGCPADNLG